MCQALFQVPKRPRRTSSPHGTSVLWGTDNSHVNDQWDSSFQTVVQALEEAIRVTSLRGRGGGPLWGCHNGADAGIMRKQPREDLVEEHSKWSKQHVQRAWGRKRVAWGTSAWSQSWLGRTWVLLARSPSKMGSEGKASACNAGDPDSIPGAGSSPGEGNGNPLQYSCLENSMDKVAWRATVHGVAKSQTPLSN